jgi:hypothetical protein
MRKRGAALIHVGGTGVLKALATVRTTAHYMSIVVVLAVVLPSALAADFIPSPLGQSCVPAAWTGQTGHPCWSRTSRFRAARWWSGHRWWGIGGGARRLGSTVIARAR